MTDAIVIHSEATVPAFPLGRPDDGRERFSMTPIMAEAYRALIYYKDEYGKMPTVRTLGSMIGQDVSATFRILTQLHERGWIAPNRANSNHRRSGGEYQFVLPIRFFKSPNQVPFQ